MPFNFDSYLGINQQALQLQSYRAQILASNLANADTPNYKARDIDFRAVLSAAGGQGGKLPMLATEPGHIEPQMENGGYDLMYRNPYQPSLDGNTVEGQVEMSAYTDNAMRYLATLRILTGKLNTLRTALKGQ
ncbi:MAG: flagellar basal body rod protein FlgB [Gammaproteobacteria bacterium]|nr:flagellar basal body rod protein FlgB [Gammaproteobacteria bacterium]